MAGLGLKILQTISLFKQNILLNDDTKRMKVWRNYSRQSNYYDQIVESHFASIATVKHLKKIPQNRVL